jgi:OmpA-OmpF porin, OOP family
MSRLVVSCVVLMIAFGAIGEVDAQGTPSLPDIERLMDSARAVEAGVFAPKTFGKAEEQVSLAKRYMNTGRTEADVAKYLAKAREYAENALKAVEVCKLSVKEYMPPRDRARAARAPQFVPALYATAETQFTAATAKVESGDVKGALKEAAKALPLFDKAEFEAIQAEILARADTLIAAAVTDEAPKYALATLDKAKTARARAFAILTANRYHREEATREAATAEYEARHASNIAQSVRSLPRNDQAWEKLMLLYEIQMNRVGDVLGKTYVPFDRGPQAAADTLIAGIKQRQAALSTDAGRLNDSLAGTERQLELFRQDESQMRGRLMAVLRMLGADTTLEDPLAMLQAVDSGVGRLVAERSTLSQQMASEQDKMSQLSEQHEELSAELKGRQEREERLVTAKTMIDPTEGELFVNAANDIVLRLAGFSFAAGKSEITDQQVPLLEKVKGIIALFPEARLVVEGHTDDRGDAAANMSLSEKRAFAVMQYLRQTMSIPSDRIRAIGYGSDKPVASQGTAEGRAKNRRIDILIQQ